MPEPSVDLEKYRGADLPELQRGEAFITALNAVLERYKADSAELNNGLQTFELSANAVLTKVWNDDADYTTAVELKNEAASKVKRIEDKYASPTELFHAVHKAFTGLRSSFTAPWKTLGDKLEAKAKNWYLKEQRAKAEAERRLAEVAAAQKEELWEQADDLIARGQVKEARELKAQARALDAPILPEALPVVAGARITAKLKGTCHDTVALALFIGQGKAPLTYDVKGVQRPLLVVDQVVLNALVDRMGKSLSLPGITVEEDVKIGAKRL